MLKTFSRLICFGSARTNTNADFDEDPVEDNVILGYPE